MSIPSTVSVRAGYLNPQKGIYWRSIIGFELAWLYPDTTASKLRRQLIKPD